MKALDLENIVKKYSKNEDYNFDGYLMHKDEEIAVIKNTEIVEIKNKTLLPIIMLNQEKAAFENWLQTRVIDTHRTNSRQIRRRLNVRSEVPKEIVIKARAISITDAYWLKWDNEDITFSDIRERLSDGLNTIALYGNSEEIEFKDSDITPELTNIGSFEKCWKLIDGNWFMIKKGSYKENFAEVLISSIAIHLGFNAVKYESIDEGRLVRCKDFTNNAEVDFEPMFSFVRDYWEIDDSIGIIEQLGYIKEFLNIIFMDALCYNIDRHTFNFGILRKDGNPIGLAPNFDNNLGLSGVLNDLALENTWYSTSFTRYNYIPVLKKYNYIMPKVNLNDIELIIDKTLDGFKILKEEQGFNKVVLKIIENNLEELVKNLVL